MANTINAVNSGSAVTYNPTITRAATPKPAVQQPDSVKLSVAAQAKLLQQQGRSVNEIAQSLGVAASTINSDLGITTAASSTQQQAYTTPLNF